MRRQILMYCVPFFHIQLHSFTPYTSTHPLSWHRGLRMGVGLYSGGGSFSLLLLLIYFPCLRVGYFRKQIYSAIICSMKCGKTASLWWSTSFLSCFSDVLFLVFLPSACPWSFSCVLKTLSQRHHHLGPVVGLLQPAGIGCVQHRAAPASSHRGYLCSTTPCQCQNLAVYAECRM